MKKKRMEILLITLTVFALGAGVAAGLLAARLPGGSGAVQMTADRSPLADELQLNDQQVTQMRDIWESVRGKTRGAYDEAQRLEKQRDQALLALLNDDQKQAFEKISQDFARRYAELTQSRDQTFRDAVSATKQLLSDDQKKKYDEILKSHGAELSPTTQPELLPAMQ